MIIKTKKLTNETLNFISQKYANRPDKDNIFGVGFSDAEFGDIIIRELLGEDWYVVDPLSRSQVNEIACREILQKYKGVNLIKQVNRATSGGE